MDPSKLGRAAIYERMLEEIEKSGLGSVLKAGKGYEKLPMDRDGYRASVDDVQSLMGHEFARRSGALPKEHPTIKTYMSPDYRYINAVRRGDTANLMAEPTEFHKTEADILEQLIDTGVDLPYDITVHRGLGKWDNGRIQQLFDQRHKGDEVGNLGFLSTTIDPTIADDFTGSADPVKAILEIPAGEKFIPIPGIERELLFSPRRTFEILDINRDKRSLRARLQPGKIWSDTRNSRGRLIGSGALGALLPENDDGE